MNKKQFLEEANELQPYEIKNLICSLKAIEEEKRKRQKAADREDALKNSKELLQMFHWVAVIDDFGSEGGECTLYPRLQTREDWDNLATLQLKLGLLECPNVRLPDFVDDKGIATQIVLWLSDSDDSVHIPIAPIADARRYAESMDLQIQVDERKVKERVEYFLGILAEARAWQRDMDDKKFKLSMDRSPKGMDMLSSLHGDQLFCADSWCTGACGLPALVLKYEGSRTEKPTEFKAHGVMVACGPVWQPFRVQWKGEKVYMPERYNRDDTILDMWWW